ncbi:response regulator [Flavobacterium proteolyticum]|uniref:Response regulator n=1 Tax=Flavobacterium proteolyticum TaxID=2911683 RepID=A0ABR9WR59_9FLAO|nr:response regulator [Flavobacterium proteolyticum]MBE9576410.1 response regulator [Flavobacterium proteolyticum]
MFVDERKYNIIVIEDNFGDFFLLEEYVSEKIKNPTIKHLERFSELNDFKDEVGQYDIIFLDLSLPDKSGSELVESVLKIAKNIPVVVLTGYSDFSFALKAIALGASDYLLKDELNSVTLYKSIVYNIERFKNIIKIKESEQLYNDLFELSPQPIFVIDAATLQILDVNQACEKLYEFKKEELLNQSITTIFKDEETIFDNHQTIITQTHQKKNKEKIISEVKYNKIIHNNKEAIIIVSNDITKSIEHLNEIESQNTKLKDIAWIQSHIVRAPLTNILGLIQLINETESVKDKELLLHLNQSVQELDNSINEIVNKTHAM